MKLPIPKYKIGDIVILDMLDEPCSRYRQCRIVSSYSTTANVCTSDRFWIYVYEQLIVDIACGEIQNPDCEYYETTEEEILYKL